MVCSAASCAQQMHARGCRVTCTAKKARAAVCTRLCLHRGVKYDAVCVSMILLVSDTASTVYKRNRVPRRSSQDSIYREREPETADRGSDGDDANETCAAGAGLMSRNSLKTSAVGAS